MALSADSGDIIWQSRPSKANGLIKDDLGTVAISPFNPNKVFYGSNGYAICLDQHDGKVVTPFFFSK
jgi:outer membrane protein assembly factor BamB